MKSEITLFTFLMQSWSYCAWIISCCHHLEVMY